MLKLLCGVFLVFFAVVAEARASLRKKVDAVHLEDLSLIHAPVVHHKLRVCNAYPYRSAVDVYRGAEKLTSDMSLPYKTCQDFKSELQVGDKLDFKMEGAAAGTFAVSDLPGADAILLLVIHRHDQETSAVAFESHIFANLLDPQIAVIDTYKGSKKSSPRICDAGDPGNTKQSKRREELRYNSVFAVNPGSYVVELVDPVGVDRNTSVGLFANNRESYVVLRVGVDAEQGPAYPEDLVVFPAAPAEHSAASPGCVSRVTFLMGLAVVIGFV